MQCKEICRNYHDVWNKNKFQNFAKYLAKSFSIQNNSKSFSSVKKCVLGVNYNFIITHFKKCYHLQQLWEGKYVYIINPTQSIYIV